VQWTGTDAVSRVEGPRANANVGVAVFYVFCLLVSSFLIINLVVSVFVEAYYSAATAMAMGEEKAEEPRAKFRPLEPDPSGRARQAIIDVVTTTPFDMLIASFIVINITTMAFESFKQSRWQSEFAANANIFFTLVFGWECLFKICGFCPSRYHRGGWNRFDFAIVMISYAGILIDGLGSAIPMNPRTIRVLRLFRIFRILRAFRILRSAKGLARILSTLVKSLPALRNLMLLLLLLFFVFAVLGVVLFGNVCVAGEELAPGLAAVRCTFSEQNPPLDPRASFRDLGHSLLSLFRVATTDGWSALMLTVLVSPGRRELAPSLWRHFLQINGTAPAFGALEPPIPDDYMSIVKASLQGWKAAAMPADGSPAGDGAWPYPNTVAAGWASIAKGILETCITDDEAEELEASGLMDCSTLGQKLPCTSTCTDPVTGYIYFGVFTLMSAFFLMQLVIAVLLEQLINVSDKVQSMLRTPGCARLRRKVFSRMERRWRFNALKKLHAQSHLQKQRQLERVGDSADIGGRRRDEGGSGNTKNSAVASDSAGFADGSDMGSIGESLQAISAS
jgi:hypothetical protein